jgi:hypothetical protein
MLLWSEQLLCGYWKSCGVPKLAEAEKSLQEVHEDGMQDTDKNEWKAQNNVLRTESNCNLE